MDQYNKSNDLHVLLIDDDEDAYILTRDLFSDFIEHIYLLEWVSTYNEAVSIMPRNEHDVFIIDYQLGARNGLELINEVTAKGCTSPIILLTGTGDHEVDIAAMKAGASDFLVKGQINAPILERSIRYAIERKKTLDALHNTAVELKLMNEQLKRSEVELRELNANKDKFFSIISHDLKSPFIALLGFSELIVNRIETMTQDEVVDIAQRMYFAGKNLFKLLENLLQWSRIQTGRMEYRPVKVEVVEVAELIISLLSGNALHKKITIRNLMKEGTCVYADQNMVNCILENLISNAIKFTKTGGSVTISTAEHGSYIEISVSDTGVGIPSKDLMNLFRIDQHYSTMGTAEEEGTGLGLILCRELVEKCKGTIQVQSAMGVGSTFTFTLPGYNECAQLFPKDLSQVHVFTDSVMNKSVSEHDAIALENDDRTVKELYS